MKEEEKTRKKNKHSLGIQFQILFTRIFDQEKLRIREGKNQEYQQLRLASELQEQRDH
jgi:hypothetical protein